MGYILKYADYAAVLVPALGTTIPDIPPPTAPYFDPNDHTDGWQALARGYDEIGMTVESYGLKFPDPGPWAGLPAWADVEIIVELVWNNSAYTTSEQGDPIIIYALQDQFTYTWGRHASDAVPFPSPNALEPFNAFEIARDVRNYGGTVPFNIWNYNNRNITVGAVRIKVKVLYEVADGRSTLAPSTVATGMISSGVASRGKP